LRIELPSLISFKLSILVLILYFFLFIPFWKFLFSSSNPWSNFYFESFSLLAFVFLIYLKKIRLSREFDTRKIFFRNFFIGLGLGSLLIITLLILSYLFSLTGVSEKNFIVEKPVYPIIGRYSELVHWIKSIVFSVIDQIVFLAVFAQPLIKRFNLILAVYLSAILFSLLNLKLALGLFGTGLICSALFGLTGSMLPAILFQLFSVLTKELLLNQFSQLLPLLTLINQM